MEQTFAKKMASLGVNVNCIIPGYIREGRTLLVEEEKITELLSQIPKGSLGEVQDIVEAAYFLVSDSSKYMTGQVLTVSGGMG